MAIFSAIHPEIYILILYCLLFTKRSYIVKQTCSLQLQVCLSMYNILVATMCLRVKIFWLKRTCPSIWVTRSTWQLCFGTVNFIEVVQHSTNNNLSENVYFSVLNWLDPLSNFNWLDLSLLATPTNQCSNVISIGGSWP